MKGPPAADEEPPSRDVALSRRNDHRSSREPSPAIHGVSVDAAGRCAHYRGPHDVVAIRLPCCGRYYACHACHEALADHPGRPWPRGRFDAPAVLCGLCRRETAITRYLASPDACPHCGAGFNPRCRRHHPLYFGVDLGVDLESEVESAPGGCDRA